MRCHRQTQRPDKAWSIPSEAAYASGANKARKSNGTGSAILCTAAIVTNGPAMRMLPRTITRPTYSRSADVTEGPEIALGPGLSTALTTNKIRLFRQTERRTLARMSKPGAVVARTSRPGPVHGGTQHATYERVLTAQTADSTATATTQILIVLSMSPARLTLGAHRRPRARESLARCDAWCCAWSPGAAPC
jgi:hypothetical protein